MKKENIFIADVIKFKTTLLNKEEEDIGIVKNISFDEEWNEWYIEVIPFNLKISSLLLNPKRIYKKIGKYSNFDFTSDASNHDFPLEYKFILKLSNEFYEKFIKEIGYFYWKTPEEMKKSFNELDKIECILDRYLENHMYHVFTKIHDLRLSDKFIKAFSI